MKETQNPLPTKLVKVRDAAAYLAVSERTVWNLEREGKIRGIHMGRVVRYAIEDLDAFIQICKGKSQVRRQTHQCMDCRYWVEIDRQGPNKERTGGCKRYPPKFKRQTENIPIETCYITTMGGDWCGEFCPK